MKKRGQALFTVIFHSTGHKPQYGAKSGKKGQKVPDPLFYLALKVEKMAKKCLTPLSTAFYAII